MFFLVHYWHLPVLHTHFLNSTENLGAVMKKRFNWIQVGFSLRKNGILKDNGAKDYNMVRRRVDIRRPPRRE